VEKLDATCLGRLKVSDRFDIRYFLTHCEIA